MNEKGKKLPAIPLIKEFCLDVPLYKSFEFDKSKLEEILVLKYIESIFDCYCIQCGRSSVFKSNGDVQMLSRHAYDLNQNKAALLAWAAEKEVIERKFYCSRNPQHLIVYQFLRYNSKIIKIVQYPSLADLAEGNINKYGKVLGKEGLKEFKRAVGLSSHGIGIGAFVYLRRIFEKLIEDAHQKAAKVDTDWDEETYAESRMDEKIGLLKDYLPAFLA
jgi:hypothetical protein